MRQSETAFLLSLLNSQYKQGREADNLGQAMVIHRLFELGLWVEFHSDRQLWYAHVNDESGKWKD